MRQFYLLLGEWYAQLRIEDLRTYRLLCCWVTDAPAFETLFPLWAASEPGEDDLLDGAASFSAVTAAFNSYAKNNGASLNGRRS